MPDVGGYEPRRLPRGDDPRGAHARWSDAFAALPKDAPDAGGWQRLTARLPAQATPARARWPLWHSR